MIEDSDILEIKGACNIIFKGFSKEAARKYGEHSQQCDKCNLSFGPIIRVVYPLPRETNKRHKVN